jgi:hypothetical protein
MLLIEIPIILQTIHTIRIENMDDFGYTKEGETLK